MDVELYVISTLLGHDFAGRPDMEMTRLVVEGKNIVLGDYGPAWKLQRKITHSALRVYGSARGALEEKITEEVCSTENYSACS